MASKNSKSSNGPLCAALSYILIGIIWFFVDEEMRKDKVVRFHVQQGIVLLIVAIILDVVASVLWFLSWILWPVVQVLILVWVIIGIVNALTGKQQELFLIGQFGKKLDI